MDNIAFLDTETTHVDPTKAHIVEIAIICGNDMAEWKIKPPKPIEIGAMATHHITENMVLNCPYFRESEAYTILSGLLSKGSIFVAHNAPYDILVLENDGIIAPMYIDTLRVARHILDDNRIQSFGLQYLRYYYNLDDQHEGELKTGFAHSALYDTIVLKWLYQMLEQKVLKLYPGKDPIQVMLNLTTTPVLLTTFTFGKHSGRRIEDIARIYPDYLEWLLNSESQKPQHEINRDMVHTLKYYLKR